MIGGPMSEENRRDPRYCVAVDASFGDEEVAGSAVRVTNLSARGCRFSTVRRLE
jgi:deoxyinosine 3'endonuclease (endonuclease V)